MGLLRTTITTDGYMRALGFSIVKSLGDLEKTRIELVHEPLELDHALTAAAAERSEYPCWGRTDLA